MYAIVTPLHVGSSWEAIAVRHFGNELADVVDVFFGIVANQVDVRNGSSGAVTMGSH